MSTTTGRLYQMKHLTTCAMHHIVYLLICPCKKQYVGCTICLFSIRVNEHITNIKSSKTNHSVPKHYLRHHNKDTSGTQFLIIDKLIPHWRGDSSIRSVSRLETFWIHELKSYWPHGMNVDWDINAIINKS